MTMVKLSSFLSLLLFFAQLQSSSSSSSSKPRTFIKKSYQTWKNYDEVLDFERRRTSQDHKQQQQLESDHEIQNVKTFFPNWIQIRGGVSDDDDDEEGEIVEEILSEEVEEEGENDENEIQSKSAADAMILQKYYFDQSVLLQLRSTLLGEELARRGLPLTTLKAVSSTGADDTPISVDWDCAMSTQENPKTCLYSFDAEPGTKVVAPIGTTEWIGLTALNRLRRMDPAKVEPMWHSRYAILQSWFGDESNSKKAKNNNNNNNNNNNFMGIQQNQGEDEMTSEYSLLQHSGIRGFLVSYLLLDFANGLVLRGAILAMSAMALLVFMPILEYVANRLFVSSIFWNQWKTWRVLMHAALPLRLLVAQMLWKAVAGSFKKLEQRIRDYFVDVECSILEKCVPITVGKEEAD